MTITLISQGVKSRFKSNDHHSFSKKKQKKRTKKKLNFHFRFLKKKHQPTLKTIMTKKVLMRDDDNKSIKVLPCGYELNGKLSKRNLQLRLHKKACEMCRTGRGIDAEIPDDFAPTRTNDDGLRAYMRGDTRRPVSYTVKSGLISDDDSGKVRYGDIVDDEDERQRNEFSYLRKKLNDLMKVGYFNFDEMPAENRVRLREILLDCLQQTKEQLASTEDPAEAQELKEYARTLIKLDIECKKSIV
jgi:hypothetical protein